jgi:hypothetical protein
MGGMAWLCMIFALVLVPMILILGSDPDTIIWALSRRRRKK